MNDYLCGIKVFLRYVIILSSGGEGLLWVDKYRPKSIKNIIGQHGERSNAKKLLKWLQSWEMNREDGEGRGGGAKRPWGGGAQDDGASFKAALLSGPPGVGKTTTATLVCEVREYTHVSRHIHVGADLHAYHYYYKINAHMLSHVHMHVHVY